MLNEDVMPDWVPSEGMEVYQQINDMDAGEFADLWNEAYALLKPGKQETITRRMRMADRPIYLAVRPPMRSAIEDVLNSRRLGPRLVKGDT